MIYMPQGIIFSNYEGKLKSSFFILLLSAYLFKQQEKLLVQTLVPTMEIYECDGSASHVIMVGWLLTISRCFFLAFILEYEIF